MSVRLYMHVCACIYVCVHAYVSAYMCVRVHVSVCVCMCVHQYGLCNAMANAEKDFTDTGNVSCCRIKCYYNFTGYLQNS